MILALTLAMTFALCGCAIPDVQVQNPDGSLTLVGVALEQAVMLLYRLVWALAAAFAAWTMEKLGQNVKLTNVSVALQTVCEIAQQTAEELQQTIVADLKAERPDGKLTRDDVRDLNTRLRALVKAKLDTATIRLVTASGADLDALISGACEAFLSRQKARADPLPAHMPEHDPDEG